MGAWCSQPGRIEHKTGGCYTAQGGEPCPRTVAAYHLPAQHLSSCTRVSKLVFGAKYTQVREWSMHPSLLVVTCEGSLCYQLRAGTPKVPKIQELKSEIAVVAKGSIEFSSDGI